jgi:hypothetical protein
MRNALLIGLFASLAMGVPVTFAVTGDSSNSVYTTPVSAAMDGSNALLPVQGVDLPLTASSVGGLPSAAAQASAVEAIPTPTAFQTGMVLLAGMALVRGAKKLRSV